MSKIKVLIFLIILSGCDGEELKQLENRVDDNENEIMSLKLKMAMIQCQISCKPNKAKFHLEHAFNQAEGKACECENE